MIVADVGQFALTLIIVGACFRLAAMALAGTPFGTAISFVY